MDVVKSLIWDKVLIQFWVGGLVRKELVGSRNGKTDSRQETLCYLKVNLLKNIY